MLFFYTNFSILAGILDSGHGICLEIPKTEDLKHNNDFSAGYSTDLTPIQTILLKANLDGALSKLRKYTPEAIINAISYVVKTGCQWSMLPNDFPKWKTVYHHFRSLCDRGWFRKFLRVLVEGRRASSGQYPEPYECVIDSQSVRSALSDSQKGIDGNKRIKGIKRHVTVDSNGYVLEVTTTIANIHDSKGAIPLIAIILSNFKDVSLLKADMGYIPLKNYIRDIDGIFLDCVKSNFGTPDFIPIQGRWVVERTFAWMENYRRLTRNYHTLFSCEEKFPSDNNLISKNGSSPSYPYPQKSIDFGKKLPLSGVFSVNFAKSHRSRCSHRSLFNLRNLLENTPPLH